MKIFKTLWVIMLICISMVVVSIPALARDNASDIPPHFTVRFAPSPGTFPEGVSGVRTGLFGFRIDSFPEPVPPPGYSFIGWFSDGVQMHAPIAAVRSTTIMAAYAPIVNSSTASSFAVVYDPGLGQLPQGVPPIQSFTYGSVLTSLPVPVLEGYSFSGWMWNGESVLAPHIVRSDMALEAVWSAAYGGHSFLPLAIPDLHFVAAFNPFPGVFNGDEVGMRFGRQGTAITDFPQEPTRQDYVFDGWKLPNGANLDTLLVMRNDIALMAIWVEAPYNSDAEASSSAPMEVRHNPQTNPVTISITIFAAVLLLGGAVSGIYRLNMKRADAEDQYHAYITRCIREVKIVIKSQKK